jgi:hypothetical protein
MHAWWCRARKARASGGQRRGKGCRRCAGRAPAAGVATRVDPTIVPVAPAIAVAAARLPGVLRLAIAVTTALLLGAPTAAAARTLHVDDPLDAQDETSPTRTLTPDITALDVSYDDAGAVTIALTFASVDDQAPGAEILLGCAGTPLLTAYILRDLGDADVDEPGWDDRGTARVDGVATTLSSTIHSADGSRTLRAAFSGAPLAGRGYRCASAYWRDAEYPYYLDDTASGWFADFEPQRLTPELATQLAGARLTTQLGPVYGAAERRYLGCPRRQLRDGSQSDPGDPAGDPAPALARCRFWLRTGSTVTFGGATVRADDQARSWLTGVGATGSYHVKWRHCPTGDRRKRLRANAPCATPKQLAATIFERATKRAPRPLPRRFKVVAHGPGLAGHEPLVRFTCRARGGSVRCANALGERLRLRLALR